jgi:hypothetical protein
VDADPPPKADPSQAWPSRRRALFQWAAAIVAIWELMVLLAMNVATAEPKPTWLIIMALCTGPVLTAAMLLPYLRWGEREHRRAAGLCLACGYSLQGNISGQCPECGAAIGKSFTD